MTICIQGVGGFVFGNENSASNEDRYKHALLISQIYGLHPIPFCLILMLIEHIYGN